MSISLANKQTRAAVDNICGLASEYTGTQGSAIIKVFDMTAAATGINSAAGTGCTTLSGAMWASSGCVPRRHIKAKSP